MLKVDCNEGGLLFLDKNFQGRRELLHIGVWDWEKNQLEFVGASDTNQFIGGVSLRMRLVFPFLIPLR
jgi:hypothetical protein